MANPTTPAARIASNLTATQRAAVYEAAYGDGDRISTLAPTGLVSLQNYKLTLTNMGRAVAAVVAG